MKFLLASTGFSCEEIVVAAEQLMGKDRKDVYVGIINEAYTVEHGDKKWAIDEMHTVSQYFPKYVDLIDLLGLDIKQIMARIDQCDMIYVVGGSCDYLMKILVVSGVMQRFEEFMKDRLFVGSSAGAMIVGKRPPADVYGSLYGYGDEDDYGFTNYMNIVPHCLITHMNETNFDDISNARLDSISKRYQCRLDGINNSQAIAVGDDGTISYINGDPYTIGLEYDDSASGTDAVKGNATNTGFPHFQGFGGVESIDGAAN